MKIKQKTKIISLVLILILASFFTGIVVEGSKRTDPGPVFYKN